MMFKSEKTVMAAVSMQSAFTDTSYRQLAGVAKRPKGWKPVCPNLPKCKCMIRCYSVNQPIIKLINVFT